jgi:hypothetical protein
MNALIVIPLTKLTTKRQVNVTSKTDLLMTVLGIKYLCVLLQVFSKMVNQ